MKILGIHGRASHPKDPQGTWGIIIADLEACDHNIDVPQFDDNEDPTYESWAQDIEQNIDEIYIVHSDDDELVPYSEGIKFQKQIGGELITVSGVGHKLAGPAIEMIRNLAVGGKK